MTTVSKTKALRVATRCTTIDQFVATFHRFCDETSFFISTLGTRPVGLETPFSIQLEDGKPVLQGLCVVLEAFPTPANRYERPGVRLGLRRLTNDSVPIYKQLLAARSSTGTTPSVSVRVTQSVPRIEGTPIRADATPIPRPPPVPGRLSTFETQQLVSPPAKTDTARIDYTPPAGTNPSPGVPEATPADKTEPTPERPAITRSYSELTTKPSLEPPRVEPLMPPPVEPPPLIPPPVEPRTVTPVYEPRTATPPRGGSILASIARDASLPPKIRERDGAPSPKIRDLVAKRSATATGSPTTEPAKTETPPIPSPKPFGAVTPSKTPTTAPRLSPAAKPTAPELAEEKPSVIASSASAASTTPISPASSSVAASRAASSTAASSSPTSSAGSALSSSSPTSSIAWPGAMPAPASAVAASSSPPLSPRTTATPSSPWAPAGLRRDPTPIPSRTTTPAPSSDPAVSRTATGPVVSRTATPPVVSRTTTPPSMSRTQTAPIAIDTTDIRTPGSEFVLPANPLMNLTDESLEGFVDCTIYEETGNFFEDGSLANEEGLATPRTRTASMAALAEPLAMPSVTPPPEPTPTTSAQFPAYAPFSTMSSIQPFTPPPVRTATSEIAAYPRTATGEISRVAASEMPALSRTATGDLPSYPQASPTEYPRLSASYPAMQAPPSESVARTRPGAARKLDKRRMMMIGGAAAIGLLVIVVVVVLASGGSDDQATAAAQPRTSAIVAPHPNTDAPVVSHTDPPPTPHVAPSPQHANDEDVPPPPNGPPVVGSGPCKLTVTTTPAGSIIQVDGNTAGPSPLTIANACQRTRIDVAHPRYQSQARFVALTADHPGTLDVTLSRPTHAVTVLTLPPGAEVLIDGRRAGTTPTIVQVMGFTSVDLTIEKGGYKTLTKRVYSRVPQDRVFVKLDKK